MARSEGIAHIQRSKTQLSGPLRLSDSLPIADCHRRHDVRFMLHHADATIAVPHGVVFLYDPTMAIDIPSDTSAAPVSCSSDCLALWTVNEADGLTTLVLADNYDGSDCKLVFEGSLSTKGRTLAFNT